MAEAKTYTSFERLYITGDGKVVREGEYTGTVTLLVAEGGTISEEFAKQYGLIKEVEYKPTEMPLLPDPGEDAEHAVGVSDIVEPDVHLETPEELQEISKEVGEAEIAKEHAEPVEEKLDD